jgi:hypothetical protein
MRDGVHQGLTMSHCANCHVESYGRKLDQTTNTLAAEARVNAGRFTMDYTFENRRFAENAPTPRLGEHWRAGPRAGVLAYTGWRAAPGGATMALGPQLSEDVMFRLA